MPKRKLNFVLGTTFFQTELLTSKNLVLVIFKTVATQKSGTVLLNTINCQNIGLLC